jgi:hypothetical protein
MPETFPHFSWYDVPAATNPSQCKKCKAVVYWITTKSRAKGRGNEDVKVPVDCEVDGAFVPTSTEQGRGVTHFRTCPNASDF